MILSILIMLGGWAMFALAAWLLDDQAHGRRIGGTR